MTERSLVDSGVTWLGNVPSHWAVKALKWAGSVKRGASPRPIDDPKYFDENGEFSWVRIEDVTASDGELKSSSQRLSALGASLSVKLEPGNLFLSIAGSVGKPCIANIRCCIHDGFVYFPRWKGNPRFLYYIFASGQPYKGLGKLGTQLNLNTEAVGSIRVAMPPRTEQDAIVGFLDRKTAAIDDLIKKKERLIELLQERWQALITQAVTKGLDPKVPMRESGLEQIGVLPSHWKLTRLRFLVSSQTAGPYGSSLTKAMYSQSGFRVYGQQQVISNDFAKGDHCVSLEKFAEMRQYEVRPGDLLVTVMGEWQLCLRELSAALLTRDLFDMS